LMLDETRRLRALRWVLVANLFSYLLMLPFSVLHFHNLIIPTYENRLRHRATGPHLPSTTADTLRVVAR